MSNINNSKKFSFIKFLQFMILGGIIVFLYYLGLGISFTEMNNSSFYLILIMGGIIVNGIYSLIVLLRYSYSIKKNKL